MGALNRMSPLGFVGALALHVTLLFPKIFCSLQSANPQATEKALQQVTCAHPSCGSMHTAPQTAGTVASHGIHQAWIEVAVVAGFDHWSLPLQHLLSLLQIFILLLYF